MSEEIDAEMKFKIKDFDGKVIWENASLVDIPANSSDDYFDVNISEFKYKYRKQIDQMVFVAELVKDGEVLSKNTYYFMPFKAAKN